MTGGAPLATLLAAALLLAACSAPAQQQPAAARRFTVAPPSIEMAAREVRALPGSHVALLARTNGGEAMLFSVDWNVTEGSAGGTVEAGRRNSDGSYEATYVAPGTPGTFHVTATIREFPSAAAMAVVVVAPR